MKKMSYAEIVSVLNDPVPGMVEIGQYSEEHRNQLIENQKNNALKFMRNYFGPRNDWETVKGHKRIYDEFCVRMDNLESNECPYTLLTRFKDSLMPHTVNAFHNVLKASMKLLSGKAVGRCPIGKLDEKTAFDVKQMLMCSVRRYFNQIFEAWEERSTTQALFRAFMNGMDKLKSDEDPFVYAQRFLNQLRNIDPFDSRLIGEESVRAMTRRAKKVADGVIKAGSPKSPRKQVDDTLDEVEEWKQLTQPVGRDQFFALHLSDSAMDDLIEKDNLDYEPYGTDDDGTPLVRVTAGIDGAWAIYRAEKDGYVRTFKNRPRFTAPTVALEEPGDYFGPYYHAANNGGAL